MDLDGGDVENGWGELLTDDEMDLNETAPVTTVIVQGLTAPVVATSQRTTTSSIAVSHHRLGIRIRGAVISMDAPHTR